MGPYDDMIQMPRPTSAKHPRMSTVDRAAQFSPFAALSGHGAAIRETARLTDQRIELDEDRKAELDLALRHVAEQPAGHQRVCMTYFRPDSKKMGGSYETLTGFIKRIDDVGRTVLMIGGAQISIDDILEIECEAPAPQAD